MEAMYRVVDGESMPMLLRTVLAHAGFEALRPFENDNGRVERMPIAPPDVIPGAMDAGLRVLLFGASLAVALLIAGAAFIGRYLMDRPYQV